MKLSPGFRWTVGLIFGTLLLLPTGLMLPIDIALAVAFGWPFYLARVLPEVVVSPAGLATAAVCLIGFTAGSHLFLAWLHGEVRGPEAGRWRARWTAQLVATTMLMFTAGLAAAGVAHQVGWVLASPFRDIVGSPRLAVSRLQSFNNLKQIGLAYHQYANGDAFPPGATTDGRGEMLHSWQTLILPFMEASIDVDLTRPWDDPANADAIGRVLPFYLVPGVPGERDPAGRGLSHYEGNARVVGGFKRLTVLDVPDGFGATILAGESAGAYLSWGEPGHWRDPADGLNVAPDRGLGGPFPGGANVLMLDGSVHFIKNTTNPSVLKALATPAGGESIHPDSY